MAKIFLGFDKYGIEGVDREFIEFVFDVFVSMMKLTDKSEAGLVVTSDEQMRKLNNQYRGKDKSTNVLSFGYLETSVDGQVPAEDKHYLGDIYISYAITLDEAREMGVAPKERFTHLFVHGLLHLVGMDHETEAETKKMEAKEDEILAAVLGAE